MDPPLEWPTGVIPRFIVVRVSVMPLRTFTWWFAMGSVLTLAVLMVQGGIRDLLEGTQPAAGTTAVVSFGTTILGGGLLAGCLAVVLNRLR